MLPAALTSEASAFHLLNSGLNSPLRWLKDRKLDLDAFRQAVNMKQKWNEHVFSLKDWRETGFDLYQWMAEHIVLGDVPEAKRIYERYYGARILRRRSSTPEHTFYLVADSLAHPEDGQKRIQAETALDKFYGRLTDWAPDFRCDELPEDRLLYAYLRGKHFKGEEDPIRLIRRMKFSE